MKKRNLAFCGLLCLVNLAVFGTWKVGTITNSSDLVLESACYEKPLLTAIPYLTNKLQESKASKSTVVEFNYTVADTASGVSVIKAEHGYQLTLDDNLTHFIQSGRLKIKRKCVAKHLGSHKKHRHLAQVFLEVLSKTDNKLKDVKCVVHGYDQDAAVFNIVLSGAAGNYKIQLNPA